MKKFFLIAGIISSLATIYLVIVFITGLIKAFKNTQEAGNPILLSIIFFGPVLLVTGFVAWACWMYYANEPVFTRKKHRKINPGTEKTGLFWSDISDKSLSLRDQVKKEDKDSSSGPK
jgi:hypothetical protein